MRNELVYFLIRLVPGQVAMAVVSSILAGVSTVALFAFIFSAARRGGPGDLHGLLIFVSLAVVFIACRSLAAAMMIHIGSAVVGRLRDTLIARILRTPYRQLESIGTPRLMSAITADVQTIAFGVPALVHAGTSFAVVASLLAYMTWLSPVGAAAIVASAIIGVPIYWNLISRATRLSYSAGKVWERLNGNLDALILGIKQLSLNRARTSQFLSDDIAGAQAEFLKLRERATLTTTLATNTAQAIFLTVLGALLFLQYTSYGPARGVEFFFAAIYLMGPLEGGIGAMTSLVHVGAVFNRNRELGLILESSSRQDDPEPDASKSKISWQQVRFDRVTYSYDDSGGFMFGPIDLVLTRGEIVFVKGGNGSGKSTFAKLLSALYDPASGSILVDKSRIDESNRRPYREQFCCIFDDSYVFESIQADESSTADDVARALISEWSMERKVDVCRSRLTNTRALSRGQKKKLLLILAAVEDREIYVFDEWAADQDAASRKKFYYEFLPRLKHDGKLVVVLTHDEGFDEVADRVIKFHDGKLVAAFDEIIDARDSSLATSI
jgi:putative ATP-binding cassette transporter